MTKEKEIIGVLTGSGGIKGAIEPKTLIVQTTIHETGPPGPRGPVADTFIHDQQKASAEWQIEHNLDKYPSVTIVDSTDRYVIGNVQYVNRNMLIVSFSAGFAGKAYLN